MKFLANDYEAKDVCRLMREATNLTQEKFGKSLHRTDRSIRMLESGETHITLETLLEIARTHKFKVIIEKEEEVEGQN